MLTPHRGQLQALALLFSVVHLSSSVCVDVPSDTEAVLGKTMRLTCISCMKREEVKARTRVDWYFRPNMEENVQPEKIHIYTFEESRGLHMDISYKYRLVWNGSQDLQDVSVLLHNITYNDSGVYECRILREFEFGFYTPSFPTIKNITLKVIAKATEDPTAIYSEIMMYVLLVFLTFWLLVEMVYCYRKISKSDEQPQDTAY
ncbi:sodium channel regulatory subunit beta-3 [Pholidichthys leucotaenia]